MVGREKIHSNKNLKQQEAGIITLRGFMFTAGFLYLVSTILVLIFKKEIQSQETKLSMLNTYKTIWKILCIPSIKKLVVILLTVKVYKIIYGLLAF